jgi:branched-chain amino acid transport system permease protein
MSQLSFGIYGFLLVMMMILRPQGLLPERRREAEMTHSDEHAEESVFVARG